MIVNKKDRVFYWQKFSKKNNNLKFIKFNLKRSVNEDK